MSIRGYYRIIFMLDFLAHIFNSFTLFLLFIYKHTNIYTTMLKYVYEYIKQYNSNLCGYKVPKIKKRGKNCSHRN